MFGGLIYIHSVAPSYSDGVVIIESVYGGRIKIRVPFFSAGDAVAMLSGQATDLLFTGRGFESRLGITA